MNFLSNVLNSIPVVGHVKGGIHYLAGDAEGGHRAMYQSTRTSAVMAGGAAGLVLGPAGAAVGAVYAGMATDLVASGVSGKPQGIIQNCESVGNDIATGKNPMGSIASTVTQIALDGVGGIGMGGVSTAATQISETAVANSIQNVGKKVVSVVGEEVLEKTFQVSAKEVTKAIGKKASEKVVRQVIQQTAMAAEVALVTTHVAKTATKQTQQDEENKRNEQERRDRERRERERRERERRERERREREERVRREIEERERREREERERRERERIERAETERREREGRERQARQERERLERQERQRRVDLEREMRQQERQWLENEQRERLERQERERRADLEREMRDRRERERNQNNSIRTSKQNITRPTTTTIQQENNQATSSAPSQPPQQNGNNNNNNNKNNNNKKKKKTDQEILDEFLQLLRTLLSNIYGSEKETISALFSKSKLAKHRTYLVKVLRTLDNFATLEAVLDTVIKMFKDHMPNHITFENFLSLLEFVRSYLNDKIDEIQTESTQYTEGTYDERRAQILRDIRSHEGLVEDVVLLFDQLKAQIQAECAPSPDFRDMFAKVYHYYKHRRIPELPNYEEQNIQVPDEVREFIPDNGILSVRQYFYWVRTLIEKLKGTPQYQAGVENQPPPITCVYQIYVEMFGHRFRVVVKVRRGPGGVPVPVTSTVFIDDSDYHGDAENGYEHWDIQKK